MNLFKSIYSLSVFPLFAFPLFKENITMKFFLLFGVLSMINFILNKERSTHLKKWLIHLVPFFIVLLSSIFHFSLVENAKAINQTALFVAMPLVFYISSADLFTKEKISNYLHFMCYASCVLIMLYLVLFVKEFPVYDLFRTKYNSSLFRDFVYDKTGYFTIHPAYFSSVLLFLTAFSLEQIRKQFNIKYLFFILCFYVFTFLLLTKLNILLINILLFFAFLFYFKWPYYFKVVSIFVILVLGYFLIINIPAMMLRIEEMYVSFFTKPEGLSFDSTNIRKAIYTCDLNLIKENFLFGIGFANIDNELLSCFESNYQSTFFNDHNYLTHNYFIFIWLGSGLIGFLAFTCYLFYIVLKIIAIKSLTFSTFIIGTFFMLNIEDYFYRQNGSFFFLLIVLMLQKNIESEQKKFEIC
jgi:O-antigen ligase